MRNNIEERPEAQKVDLSEGLKTLVVVDFLGAAGVFAFAVNGLKATGNFASAIEMGLGIIAINAAYALIHLDRNKS